MDAVDVALRASDFGVRKSKKDKADTPAARNQRIELYAARLACGVDIWTGNPLVKFGVTPKVVETVNIAMLDETIAQLEIQQELESEDDYA